MKTRKLFLIVADVILLAVFVIHTIASSKSGIKTFELKEQIDELEIFLPGENILLTKENDEWLVGTEKNPAQKYSVENLIDAVSSIKVLDKVGKISSPKAEETFELSETSAIKVVAKNNGKILRTILIGKNSTVYSQSFITIDDKSDVYLATGSLRNKFEISSEDLILPPQNDDNQAEESILLPENSQEDYDD